MAKSESAANFQALTSTPKLLWKAYSTGSDKDVKIGSRFKPFYAQYKGKDLGLASWPAGMAQHGAGAAWGFISYDPETNLIFYGRHQIPGRQSSGTAAGRQSLDQYGVHARETRTPAKRSGP